MMIDSDRLADPGSQGLDVGLQENFHEWYDHTEDKPNINHLDVCSLGKIIKDSNIHRHKNQHDSQLNENVR